MCSTTRILPREITVRFLPTEAIPDRELDRRAREVLGDAERRAGARLRAAGARRDYLVAHLLARTMLADRIGADPGELRFRISPGGRPEVVAPRGAHRWRFSISHADGIALCAVSAGYVVGADVESLRSIGHDLDGVTETICSAKEREDLLATSPSLRPERLLVVWTLKEAIAKAMGLGVRLPLREITVCGTPPRVDIADLDASSWCFTSFRLSPHHVASVAVHTGGGRPARLNPAMSMRVPMPSLP